MISVLINCHNGERFLRETVKSLEDQTYKNFEVVFIDNQSSDSSIEIITNSDLNVKLFRTDYLMSLGAARNWGLSKCTRRYVTILDSDDVYYRDSLEKLLNAIRGKKVAFAYGHQDLIDSDSRVYGERKNIYAGIEGCFFGRLLVHWDIPLVGVIVDKSLLDSRSLSFDDFYQGSEEFDFFLRISAHFDGFSLDEKVVKYRVHKSLSSQLGELRHIERKHALQKIRKDFPALCEKYPREYQCASARAEYYQAQYEMSVGRYNLARKRLRNIALADPRYFLLFLVSQSVTLWRLVQKRKYGDHVS